MSGKRFLSGLFTLMAVFGAVSCMEPLAGDVDLDQMEENLALAPPTNVQATAISPTRIDVSWDPVAGAAWYVLYKGNGPGTETAYTQVNGTSAHVSNLTPGQQYCFEVRDVNSQVQISGFSAEVCATTPTTATTQPPQNVAANAISDTRITVSWSAVSGATVYHVFMRQGTTGTFSQVASVAPPATSVTIANLTPSTSYSFYVTVVTVNGESQPSAIVSATTFTLGLEGYWKFDEGTGTTAMDASGFGRNATLTSANFSSDRPPVRLTKNKYSLMIQASSSSQATVPSQSAFRFAGGAFSVSLWVKLPTSGATDIIGMRASNCGTLGWKLGQDATNMLNISGGGGTRSFGTTIPVNTWTNVAFTYANGTLTLFVNGAQTSSTAYTPANSLTNTPLTFGHVGGCAGGTAIIDEARIFSRALSAQEVATFGTVPPAPTLSVMATDASHETLTWNAVPNASQYYVYRGTAAGNETFLTTTQSTTFVGQHLNPNTQYSWYVRAEVSELDSNPSNEVLATTPDVLPAPTGVTATANSSTRVTVAWTAVTGASSYKVYQSTDNTTFVQVSAVLSPTTSVQIANLTTKTTYYYQVLAVDAGGNLGKRSASVMVTTP